MTMAKRGRTWTTELTVVGLQFRWKRETVKMLARNVPIPVALEREPDNKHDENAVKVLIMGDYKLTKLRGMHLGYLRRNIAAVIAPKLDAETIEPVKLWVTEIDPESGDAALQARFRDIPARKKARK